MNSLKKLLNELGNNDLVVRVKSDPVALFSTIVVLALVSVALAADILAPEGYARIDYANRLASPHELPPFGADFLGRSLFSRLIHGTRIIWYVIFVVSLISIGAGVGFGCLSGYHGGKLDAILARIADVLMTFPSILLALVLVSIFGFTLTNAAIAIGVAQIAPFFRLSRALTMEAKEHLYVEAAKVAGVSNARILCRHILPLIHGPLIAQAILNIPIAIIGVAALSFLGLGAQPPTPEWGLILREGRDYMRIAPHAALIPGSALFMVAFAFNMLGEALRDALDPKRKAR